MKRNKGFSLVELLVSLLVVSIALLGFAALQAFSARTIRSSEYKNVGNEITQSFVKYLQMSQDSIRGVNWANGNILFSCGNNIPNNGAGLPQRLTDGLNDLCSTVNGAVAGIAGNDLVLQFVRQTPGGLNDNYAYYSVNLRYAYRPLRAQQEAGAAELADGDITVVRFCPFADNPPEQELADQAADRVTNNVVCDIVEVRL